MSIHYSGQICRNHHPAERDRQETANTNFDRLAVRCKAYFGGLSPVGFGWIGPVSGLTSEGIWFDLV
jgi:hypothetical protein